VFVVIPVQAGDQAILIVVGVRSYDQLYGLSKCPATFLIPLIFTYVKRL